MARIVGYIAASLDGFIADPGAGVGFLERPDLDTGAFPYEAFIKGIGTVVMGRTTYDWVTRHADSWPYPGQRAYVVTSRPLPEPMAPLEIRSDIDALIAELRALDDGDVWMLGGGQLQMAFIARGALDEIEIFMVADLLGGGIPLFPPLGVAAAFELVSATPLGSGGARLQLRRADRAERAG